MIAINAVRDTRDANSYLRYSIIFMIIIETKICSDLS